MSHKKISVIASIILFLLCTVSLFAQPEVMWTVTCGGEHGEECYDVLQTDDGRYVMVGVTMTDVDWMDFFLAIIDSSGEVDTTQTYNHEGDNMCFSVAQTFDGGFIMAGCTFYFGVDQPEDVLVVKTDSIGTEVWSNSYELAAGENVRIYPAPDSSGYIIGGEYWDRQNGSSLRLIKINPDGEVLWWQAFMDMDQHTFVDMIPTSDGGYTVTGSQIYLLKIDAEEAGEWVRDYSNLFEDQWISSIAQAPDSGFAFTTYDYNDSDYYLAITDAEGNLTDSVRFETQVHTGFPFVIEHPRGGFLMSECAGFVIKRIDADLETVWRQVYSEGNCREIITTSDGGFAFAGCDEPYFGYESGDFYLIKTHPEPAGVKYPNPNTIPSTCCLVSVYPNPFNNRITINFSIAREGFVSLGVFDCAGRRITELYNDANRSGYHTLTWDAIGVPNGEYYLRLSDGNEVQDVSKLLLIK